MVPLDVAAGLSSPLPLCLHCLFCFAREEVGETLIYNEESLGISYRYSEDGLTCGYQ